MPDPVLFRQSPPYPPQADREARRLAMLDNLVSGLDPAALARKYAITPGALRREIVRALDNRAFEPAPRYLRPQIERLNRPLRRPESRRPASWR